MFGSRSLLLSFVFYALEMQSHTRAECISHVLRFMRITLKRPSGRRDNLFSCRALCMRAQKQKRSPVTCCEFPHLHIHGCYFFAVATDFIAIADLTLTDWLPIFSSPKALCGREKRDLCMRLADQSRAPAFLQLAQHAHVLEWLRPV